MQQPSNRELLIELMDGHGLSIADVERILGKSNQTIRIWRAASGQNIPDSQLRLLETRVCALKLISSGRVPMLTFITVGANRVVTSCPYCGNRHVHPVNVSEAHCPEMGASARYRLTGDTDE